MVECVGLPCRRCEFDSHYLLKWGIRLGGKDNTQVWVDAVSITAFSATNDGQGLGV